MSFFIYGFRGWMFVISLILVFIAGFVTTYVVFEVFASDIKVDNTKKRTMYTTITIMECYRNDTSCILKELYTNKTELGNVSKGLVLGTKL